MLCLLTVAQELVALGLTAPFADKGADFSQLSPQPLYISDVLQSVSEKKQELELYVYHDFSASSPSAVHQQRTAERE
jgi:hypothetical protein